MFIDVYGITLLFLDMPYHQELTYEIKTKMTEIDQTMIDLLSMHSKNILPIHQLMGKLCNLMSEVNIHNLPQNV